jgi:hypothetical protein
MGYSNRGQMRFAGKAQRDPGWDDCEDSVGENLKKMVTIGCEVEDMTTSARRDTGPGRASLRSVAIG